MKDIPQTVAANKGATGYAIRVALLVEFDSGDYCFTSDGWDPGFDDCTLRDSVVSWGGCSALMEGANPKAFAQASFSLTIGDPSGELRDLFENHQFQRTTCALYWAIFTPGEAAPTHASAVRVLRGLLVPPIVWREGDRTVGMEVTDISEANERLVGARCTVDEFEWLAKESEGKEVPIIYGRADRIRPVHLNRGPMAHIIGRQIGAADTEIIVDDAERFPQETAIQIEIGSEIISGQFVGNRFAVTSRGDTIFASTCTSNATGDCTLIDNVALPAYGDGRLAGYDVSINLAQNPYGTYIYSWHFTATHPNSLILRQMFSGNIKTRRVIRNHDDHLEYETPFEVEGSITIDGTIGNWQIDGHQVRLRRLAAYSIGTTATMHQIGDAVLRFTGVAGNLEYAVGMGACTIRQVYVHGHMHRFRSYVQKDEWTMFGGGIDYYKRITEYLNDQTTEKKDDWIPLRSDLWHAGTTTVQGKTVTTVELARYPTHLVDYICDTDDILVDVDGPSGGDGSMIVNPAEVIEHMYALYGGLPSLRGCVMRLPMDETSGRVAYDATANSNDGDLQGNTALLEGAGRVGGAVDFPGGAATDIVNVPDSASLRAACVEAFSVAFWFRLDSTTSLTGNGIMTKKNVSADATGFSIAVFPNNGRMVVNGALGNTATGPSFSLGTSWHHATVVFNGTSVQVYYDGVALVMIDSVIDAVVASTQPLRLGIYPSGAGLMLNGMLDDVRVYDRALSGAEATALYNTVVAGRAADNTDFTDAAAKLASWHMSFARQDVTPLREMTADLAFQARSRVRWLGDVPELLYQGVDGGEVDLGVAARHVIMHSAESERDPLELSATRVTARWTEDGHAKSLEEVDDDAEDDVGERRMDVDCWAYQREECPRALARFLLESFKRLHERSRMGLTVHAVGLEPGDIVEVDADLEDALAFAPVKGRVTEVTHDPGLEPDALPREDVAIRFFRWPGCQTSCEGPCETTPCEASCETYYEPSIEDCWRCETSCQTACEFYCETGLELFCSDHACETALVVGCAALCQAVDMVDICGACEDDPCQSTDCQCVPEGGE